MPLDAAIATEVAVSINGAFSQSWQNLLQPDAGIGRWIQGGTMAGARAKLPIAGMLLGNWREWLGERIFHDLTRYMMEISAKDYEMSVEVDVNEFDDARVDPYAVAALFEDIPGKLLAKASYLPERLIFDLLTNGHQRNSWDGQFFFDTDHPIDPYGYTSGVWSNVLTASPLSSTTLNAAIDRVLSWRLPDGELTNVTTADITLVVPPALRATANGIIEMDRLAGGAANPDYKLVKWEVWNRLRTFSDTTWYLLVSRPDAKPFVMLERKAPDIVVLNSPDTPNRFYHRKIHMGGHARLAPAYGLPQCALRAVAV